MSNQIKNQTKSQINEFKKIDDSTTYLSQFWDGVQNKFIRRFTYLREGFGLVNEAKNYFLILFGTYWTIKTMDYWVSLNFSDLILAIGLIVMAIVGMGVLIYIGRWDLFKGGKAQQFIRTQHGSVTKWQGHNMSVYQTILLAKLAEKLGVDMDKVEEEYSRSGDKK